MCTPANMDWGLGGSGEEAISYNSIMHEVLLLCNVCADVCNMNSYDYTYTT